MYITGKLQCMDGVVMESICYKLSYHVRPSVNYDTAAFLCNFYGGLLTEIRTPHVYNEVRSSLSCSAVSGIRHLTKEDLLH